MTVTYADILAGLTTALQQGTGLQAQRVLDHEPTAADAAPLIYSLFVRYELTRQGQLNKHLFRVLHRVVVTWQDNEGAERLLVPFLESIPAAINANPRLDGLLTEGYAQIVEADGVFVVIGGVLCRGYDFVSENFYKQGRTV